jgi:predicted ATP-grasp superfamily ATP-dependent carboligase
MKDNLVIIVNPARDHYDVVREIFKTYPSYKIMLLWSSEDDRNKIYNQYRSDNTSFHYEEIYSADLIDSYSESYNIIACIPSGDDSVELALKLQNKFVPEKSNSIETIEISKNKEKYLNLLREKNIVKTFQYELDSIEKFPVVIKPKESRGGSENVFLIESKEDLNKIKINIDSSKFVAQEFVNGTEYAVDILTFNGKHVLVLATEYSKNNDSLWQYKESVMNYKQDRYFIDEMYDYVCNCLDALNWNFGITFSQVIVDKNAQFHLIEINFRKQGHINDHSVYLSTGESLAKHISNLYLSTNILENKMSYYDYKQPYERFWVNVETSKYIESVDWLDLEKIKSFTSKTDHNVLFTMPGVIQPSTSILTSLGMVSMSHHNLEQYNSDVDLYMEWWKKYK